MSTLIVKCNDFGAGGVSVAIGELADSLDIYLDKVPKKYEGLSGTELAISESQERMAVVLDKNDVDKFIEYAKTENLAATAVAEVTDNGRMRMFYAGNCIVDLKRKFLDTNGVKQTQIANVKDNVTDYMSRVDAQSQNILIKANSIKPFSMNCQDSTFVRQKDWEKCLTAQSERQAFLCLSAESINLLPL